MIKSEFGNTQLRGSFSSVLSDFSCIVDALNTMLVDEIGESKDFAKKAIQHAFDLGFESESDLDQVKEEIERVAEEQNQSSTEEDEDKAIEEFLGNFFGKLAEAMKGGASK